MEAMSLDNNILKIHRTSNSDWGKNTAKDKLLDFFAKSKLSEREAKKKIDSLSGRCSVNDKIQHGGNCPDQE